MAFDYRTNNFNLIRLFAAVQVVVTHLHFTFVVPENFEYYISLFNGVPIFFTLSGFLIYWSFDNNPTIQNYFINRFLRIYPALICAFILTVVLLLVFHKLAVTDLTNSSFIMWVSTQLTFIQEFTPSIIGKLAGNRENAPNPPLWTISVEMLLYFSIPLVYYATKRLKKHYKAFFFLMLGVISYIQNQTGFISDFLSSLSNNGYYLIFIHPFCQFASFFWYFAIGFIIYMYKDKIIPILAGKAFLLLCVYIFMCIIFYINGYEPGCYSPEKWELISHLVLVACVFSFAYTKPDLTKRLIGNMDISYGMYIYHVLILSIFYQLGLTTHKWIVIFGIACFVVSWLSWTLVEKKALKLKKKSLYKLYKE